MTPSPVRVYLGLGSNLGERATHLTSAVQLLDASSGLTITRVSSIYETAPWGDEEQPAYLNMVLEATAELAPGELLALSQSIENTMGRERTRKWAPRVIDIDILLYGEHIIKAAELQVPHPHLSARQFVLVPLLEIAPDLLLPDGARVAELADPSSQCVVWYAAAPWPQRHRGERA